MNHHTGLSTVHNKAQAYTLQQALNLIVCMIFLIGVSFPLPFCLAAERGKAVNVTPFGELKRWEADGKDSSFGVPAFAGASAEKALRRMDYGVIWEDCRDIFRVIVRFADHNTPLPQPQSLGLEYWQSTWPKQRIPRDRPSGAGSSGWLNVGDWFQGKWLKADANLEVNDTTYTFTFNPLNAKEFPDMKDFPARYRSTLKLRVICDKALPAIETFEAYTDSTWEPLEFEVEWGATAREQQRWDGKLEVFNGIIEQIQPISASSKAKIGAGNKWTSAVKDEMDGIRASILFAKTNAYNSFDETVVTVRTFCESFSFAASDLIKHGHIFIPDFGVIVRKAGDNTTYKLAEQAWQSNKNKNIYTAVSALPEQTLTSAWKDIPQKQPFYIPLGFEGGRQHFGMEPDGSVFCRSYWLLRIPGKDTKCCLYDGDSIQYRFGLDSAKLVERGTVDGCLPMIVAQWERDGVRYCQSAFVIPFGGVPKGDNRIYADDTVVLMVRFEMSRTDNAEREAKLDIEVVARESEQLTIDNGLVFVTGTEPKRLRMLVSPADLLEGEGKKITYRAKLTADKPKRTLDITIPYITLTEPKEWAKLQTIKFDKAFKDVREYWRKRVQAGAQITTPEPMVNDFYKAHISHLLLNTEREVGDSERYMAKVGTFRYGVFSNESCMMISDLDRRGYQRRAEQALETWLHYQGTAGLPGNFSSKEGQFYGAGGYEDGGYNQHHGFVLWCLGEHYWYTRDVEWIKRAASNIIKGCEWIIQQRQRTIPEAESSPIRAIEKGLLPAGSLEDIRDWRCWLSTNVYSWWGMHNAAAALNDAGIPDGKRLLDEAATYREDILKAFTEAMQRTPVVKLRDGSWIPHIPPDVHRRGRTFGWITETLEGPIHIVACGILEPWDRRSTWIMKDYEDNLCISEQYGFPLTGEEYERYWFSRGAVSIQPNLLWMVPYLLRDEPKHFLRTYFNGFAMCYFPDTRMMTEWVRKLGIAAGDHYKSSDEANSAYWLRLMFIQERGDELWLGAAIPRYWLADGNKIGIENARTYFGPMSVKFESMADKGKIIMNLVTPRRNPPKKIFVRFRHPDGKQMTRCEIDGKAYKNFDPEKEWVVLTDCPKKTTRITAYYN